MKHMATSTSSTPRPRPSATNTTSASTAMVSEGSLRGGAVHRRRGGSPDENNNGNMGDSESGNSATNGNNSSNSSDRRIYHQRQQQQQANKNWWHSYSFPSSSSLSSLFRGLLDFLDGKRSRSPQRQQTNAGCSSRRSSVCVLASFLVWLCVIVLIPSQDGKPPQNKMTHVVVDNSNLLAENTSNGNQQNTNSNHDYNNLPVRERIQLRTQSRNNNAGAGKVGGGGVSKFLKDAASGFYNVVDKATGTTSIVQKPQAQQRSRKDKESDLPGCTRPKWQHYNFVNCNEIHEIDLATIFKRQQQLEGPAPTSTVGYIGSGLWRSVYAVDPRQSVMPNQSVAIKIMKDEHEVNTRNFDRHRRDALTMERLTSSPHIVDIYGFCGNTVLTEFTTNTLDRVIYEDKNHDEVENNGHSGDVSGEGTNNSTKTITIQPTRRTAQGRLQLFLDVARGLQAMHDIKGGPIVHADLQAKQFLINDDGVVKINDFNRCRFMASKAGVPCKFQIPSAPGKYRSPEEYSEADLDEKLDIYATASVFYGILTGETAWSDLNAVDTKKYVKRGVKPKIGDEHRMPGSIDAALTNLTELAYTKNPEERISASQLVAALEALQAKHPFLEDQINVKG